MYFIGISCYNDLTSRAKKDKGAYMITDELKSKIDKIWKVRCKMKSIRLA
ncbi:hypothetical protein HMPREF9081_0744 [Centipeda periodontii DSM 2778]|uniref:Uncharacterized protein n=1 Tax=Centipeda periodontii DSM 2778 TaxID=888060 RepID=F5RKF9_9FIRM|nr:hypothetical protein HMPREF9081_0744 [Centipeda periodontii DSM 2778]